MAEIKKMDLNFVDEQGSDFNKFGITEEGGAEKQVTLRRMANITQPGTPLDSTNLNKIPTKINEIIDEVNKIPNTYETKADANKKLTEAKEDATTKASQAESNANTYTDNKISTLSNSFDAKLGKKADLVNGKIPTNQIPTKGVNVEQAEKDGEGNVITATYETKTDSASKLKDAKTYTNEKIKELDNATYQKIVDCPHEFQITAKTGCEYNLAISDETTLKLLTIKGQTRRYSENLVNLGNQEFTAGGITAKYENGIITYNGTVALPNKFTNFFYTISTRGSYSYITYGESNNAMIVKNADGSIADYVNIPSNTVYNFVIDKQNIYEVRFYNQFDYQDTKTNYTIRPMLVQGTYTSETMPSFKPYDNTLVNAKCNLISTNKNLLDVADFVKTRNSAGRASYMVDNGYTFKSNYSSDPRVLNYANCDYYLTLPKGDYTFRYNLNDTTTTNNAACIIIFDENEKQYLNVLFKNATNYYQNFTLEKETKIGILTKTYDLKISLVLNYGTGSNIEFETQEKDTFILNEELGKFDYIDNVGHKKVKGQSPIIVASNLTFSLNPTSLTTVDIYTANLPSKCVSYTSVDNGVLPNIANFNEDSIHYYVESSGSSSILSVFIPKGQEVKTYLQSINFQFAYKLETPTITDLNLAAGYKAWNGGLQQQEPQGKYLPYVLTKEYAINQKAQIDLNADMNVEQQALIDENKTKIEQQQAKIDENTAEIELLKKLSSEKPPITDISFVGLTDISDTVLNVNVGSKINNLSFGVLETSQEFKILFIPNSANSLATCKVNYVSGDDGYIKYDYTGYQTTYGLGLQATALKKIYYGDSGATAKKTVFRITITDIYGNSFNQEFSVSFKAA